MKKTQKLLATPYTYKFAKLPKIFYYFFLQEPKPGDEFIKLRKALLISVAYSANIGGFATIIGTPPNLVLLGALDSV